jgi:hypothetical protein
MKDLPATEEAIASFIAAFEDGTLPKEQWTHSAHLLTGAWFVHQLGEEAALDHMRTCVKRYNLAVGGQNTATSGYHETVTVFWIKLLSEFLREHPPMHRAAFVKHAVEHFAPQRNIYREFYDFDVVASTAARATWIAPTLRSL